MKSTIQPSLAHVLRQISWEQQLCRPEEWEYGLGNIPYPMNYWATHFTYVNEVVKSDVLPFEFDRTLNGTCLLSSTPLGAKSYELLATMPNTALFDWSEDMKLIAEIAKGLDLLNVRFSGAPMMPIAPSGVREGELINTFATRLREAARKKKHCDKVSDRRKEQRLLAMRWDRLFQRLTQNHPWRIGLGVSVHYQDHQIAQIDITKASNHCEALMNLIGQSNYLCSLVGHAWKRIYVSETGYKTQLWLIFDGSRPPCIELLETSIRESWQCASEGRGDLSFVRYPPTSMEQLHWQVKSSILAMIYLRLPCLQNFPQFVLSDPPRKQGRLPKTGHLSYSHKSSSAV
jgi:hypothetical protein